MSIERVYSAGWGVGEKLTSAQMNGVDQALTYAVDKRSGQVDSLMSLVVATGAGRIVESIATGPDGNHHFTPLGHNQIVRIPTLTAARSYTLGHSGATGGDRILFYIEGTAMTASGYAEVTNAVGSGLYRLGGANPNATGTIYGVGEAAEFVFNGSSWQLLRGNGVGLAVSEFVSDSDWICPPGVHSIMLEGWGGGGGGGHGAVVTGVALGEIMLFAGGGGGGGAQAETMRIPVVPFERYRVAIGQGGTCPAAAFAGLFEFGGALTVNGSPGGDTTLTRVSSGEVVARFKGAAGGGAGGWATATLVHHYARGGTQVPRSNGTGLFYGSVASGGDLWPAAVDAGAGGNSASANVPTLLMWNYGMPSLRGFAGGGPGIYGTGPTAYDLIGYGFGFGAGGGGGGGGPGGAGATGGAGGSYGNASQGTYATSGLTPNNAAPNSGAGGGGGGGGGGGDGGVTPYGGGARGSNGGSGKLTIMVIK